MFSKYVNKHTIETSINVKYKTDIAALKNLYLY